MIRFREKFPTMVLYRNTQLDSFDIISQSLYFDLFQFIKELVLFLEQRFLHNCAIILRREDIFHFKIKYLFKE